MKYKIVASDLDGTLLNSSGNLSEENLSAIRGLHARSAFFVPASGRSLSEIPKVLRDEESIRFYIHSSGAGIYDKQTGENLSFGFPFSLSKEIFELVFSLDCHVTVRRGGRMLTDAEKTSDDAMLAYNVYPAHVSLLRTAGEGIENFETVMRASESVDMISLFFKTYSELEEAKFAFSNIDCINVVSACDYNLEITYSKAGKGNALSTLAESLGVNISETIAIGDSENDLQMLQAAGIGIAPSNAAADIREKAMDISCSNDENVVPYILKKYF